LHVYNTNLPHNSRVLTGSFANNRVLNGGNYLSYANFPGSTYIVGQPPIATNSYIVGGFPPSHGIQTVSNPLLHTSSAQNLHTIPIQSVHATNYSNIQGFK